MMDSHFTQHSVALGVLSITSILVGYTVGKSLRPPPPAASKAEVNGISEDTSEPTDGDLSAITAGILEPCKLVLVVRTDLKTLGAAKIAALCGQATLACYKSLSKSNPKLVKHWERTGQAKIALKGTSEKQIRELDLAAKTINLCSQIVEDSDPKTPAVLAIGPAPVAIINQVTGKLRLL